MIETLAASPFIHAIGLALVHFVWQGALIGGATAGLLHLLRQSSAAARYGVSCAALLALALAPVVTTVQLLNEPAAAPVAAVLDVAPQASATASTEAPAGLVETAPAPASSAATPAGRRSRALPVVVLLWLCGVAALTLHLAISWASARRLRRAASAVEEAFIARVAELARQLGLSVRVSVSTSESIGVPTLVGWIRPVILLPGSVLTGLTPAQLDAVLVHELAHVRRHDYLVNLLQTAIETLLFYHPAVWWVSSRVRLERELCCDDMVIAAGSDRLVYAHALASLEHLRAHPPLPALAATDGPLLARIRRIVTGDQATASRSSAWTIVAAAVLAAPVVLLGHGISSPFASAGNAEAQEVELSTRFDRPLEAPATSPLPGTAVLELPDRATAAPGALAREMPPQVPAPSGASKDEAAVLALEEEFRLAKLQNDVKTLDRLLDESYIGTNQNGNTRNKTETIGLWRDFPVSLLTLDAADVDLTGDLALVRGRQTEVNAAGTDEMLFTRVWRRANGTWRLISVTQFRNPNPARPAAVRVATQGPAQLIPLRYELYRDGALIGRPLLTVGHGRHWSIQIPDGGAVSGTAEASDSETVTLTFSSGPSGSLVLQGTTPAETSWTSDTRTYRLRVWRATDVGSQTEPIPVTTGVQRPVKILDVPPVYPPEAKAQRISGTVMVEVVIDEAGAVSSARVVRSVPIFDQAALDAVRQWRYTPAIANGKPVAVRIMTTITFSAN